MYNVFYMSLLEFLRKNFEKQLLSVINKRKKNNKK